MKVIIFALLFGCASVPPAPTWVSSLRSGEERYKLINGSSLLFRRIAGQGSQTMEQACQTAIKAAERDMRTDNPAFEALPYTVEVMYYDQVYKDCAVTLSIKPSSKIGTAPVPARAIAMSRSETAEQYAISGLSKDEFRAYTKEFVYIHWDFRHPCWQNWYKSGYSEHGSTIVCWNDSSQITGYCANGTCLSK